MKMKKITTALLTAALLAAGSATALAEPISTIVPPSTEGSSQVQAKATPTYTVVIPEKLSFTNLSADSTDADKKKDFTVTVRNLMLDFGRQLEISVGDTAGTAFGIPHRVDPGVKLPFTVGTPDKRTLSSPGVFARVEQPPGPFDPAAVQTLSGSVTVRDIPASGDYAGALKFTCRMAVK